MGCMTDRTVNGPAIRRRRQELYRSFAEFCAAAGVSGSHMNRIELGTHQPAKPWTARAIAAALGWDVEQLYAADPTDDRDAA